ncbi:MAG: hypothetical protein H0V73_01480 [Chloroflexi bacterium]|nr:hypothetical protein [Chloroflexota bacterium]
MQKRAIAAFLWFAAAWFGYEIAWSVIGVTRIAGPVIAFAIAALVTVDPMALFWRRGDAPTFSIGRRGVGTTLITD